MSPGFAFGLLLSPVSVVGRLPWFEFRVAGSPTDLAEYYLSLSIRSMLVSDGARCVWHHTGDNVTVGTGTPDATTVGCDTAAVRAAAWRLEQQRLLLPADAQAAVRAAEAGTLARLP